MPLLVTTAGAVAGGGDSGMFGTFVLAAAVGGLLLALATNKVLGDWLRQRHDHVRGHLYGPATPGQDQPPSAETPDGVDPSLSSPPAPDDFDYSIYESDPS